MPDGNINTNADGTIKVAAGEQTKDSFLLYSQNIVLYRFRI